MTQNYRIHTLGGCISIGPKGDSFNIDELVDLVVSMNLEQLVGDVEVLADPDEAMRSLAKRLKWIEAAGGLVLSDGHVLMIYRLGRWDLPKGKLEKGESVRACAMREVGEECGIRGLQITQKLSPTFHTYQVKETLVLKKTHWYKMELSGLPDLYPQTAEDITQAKWVHFNDLPEHMANTYPTIREVIDEGLN